MKPKFHTQIDMEPIQKERVSTMQAEQQVEQKLPAPPKGNVTVILKYQNSDYSFKFDRKTTCKEMQFAMLAKIQSVTNLAASESQNPQGQGSPQLMKNSSKHSEIWCEILGFSSMSKSVQIDYYLTQSNLDLSPFQNSTLRLEPFYCSGIHGSSEKIQLKDFIFIKNIGIGGFSLVYLVKKKDTGKFYAMKLIDKDFIIKNKKHSIVQNERDIMIKLSHSFLINLAFSFESKQFIVFVMEYCQGGELFFQLKQIKRMTEDQASFYIAEICLGLEELHHKDILYRDIKPENILMDIEGHVRIADFGLSKPSIAREEKAYSFCGSPEYMAPEMLLKQGHSQTVDFYCLGALLYELLTGLPPYYSVDTSKIYQDILHKQLTFPNDKVKLSPEAKNLLKQLLNKDPSQRLGVNNGIRDILNHPFFAKIDLIQLAQKSIPPPMKPDPLKMNFDESESQKGESELRQKLLNQKNSQNMPQIFGNFYYENQSERKSLSLYKMFLSEQKLALIKKTPSNKQLITSQQLRPSKSTEQTKSQLLGLKLGQKGLIQSNSTANLFK